MGCRAIGPDAAAVPVHGDKGVMKRVVTTGLAGALPLPVLAVDLEAISRGLVEAGPWGQNAHLLPALLGWLGVVLLVAVAAKLLYTGYDKWRTGYRTQKLAKQNTDEWILEVGELLGVRAPAGLKAGSRSPAWHPYRHQVKMALLNELQRGRQLAAQVADLQKD